MKTHSFLIKIIIFSSVLGLFVVPPLFVKFPHDFSWNFPYIGILYASAAGVLYFAEKTKKSQYKFINFIKDSANMWIALGEICITAAIIELGAVFLKYKNPVQGSIFPNTPISFLFCMMSFACSAFYEEVIFRSFLPESSKKIVSSIINFCKNGESDKLPLFFSCILEIAVCLTFAFSHRYLGIPAILNAAFAHIFFRICYIKTSSIWTNTTAHFIYNILTLFLMKYV